MNPRTLGLVLGALAAAALLQACGRQGELDRPKPLFGSIHPPSRQALARDEAAARARADGQARADPQAPQSVDEVRGLGLAQSSRQSDKQAKASDVVQSQSNAPTATAPPQ